MARYLNVDTLSFTNYHGNTFPVKDIREIPSENIAFEIDVEENTLLDEIASRQEVFGDFGEQQSYRIFDLNIEILTEANFDLTNIKRLKIPI